MLPQNNYSLVQLKYSTALKNPRSVCKMPNQSNHKNYKQKKNRSKIQVHTIFFSAKMAV